MKQKIIFVFIVIAAFIAGALLAYKGANKKTNNPYILAYDGAVSVNLEKKVKIVTYLKEGKTKAAEELLENLIDIDLNYFWAKHNEIKNNKDIIESLKQVQAYRNKYSYNSLNPAFNKSTQEMFKFLETSGKP